jgi:hypothetical protein
MINKKNNFLKKFFVFQQDSTRQILGRVKIKSRGKEKNKGEFNQRVILFSAILFVGAFIFNQFFEINLKFRDKENIASLRAPALNDSEIEKIVLPAEGVILPVKWGDLGRKMADAGVIDAEKLESLYKERGNFGDYERNLLYGGNNGNLKINSQNSSFILNLLWAFGLANKNLILEEGPMQNPRYGGAEIFASTGGWTLAKGKAMDHYGKYGFIQLTDEQQKIVERVSKNIYRPCCGNSTYFPDCNHGMAMLGLLELMAAQGVTEKEMYETALQVNSYWFPGAYITIAKYFQKRGVEWKEVEAKDVLGSAYSSASGFRQILEEIDPPKPRGGSGCGV